MTFDRCCSLLLSAVVGSAIAAQGVIIPPPPEPPSRGYRGPGDLIGSTPGRGGGGAPAPRPAAAAPSAPRHRAPPRPLPQHLRNLPAPVARALQAYGAPLTLEHERTARSRLTYAWEAVKVMPPGADGDTVAHVRPRALPFADAVARVAEDDARPMLVLRETWPLGAADAVAVERKLGNEKTILLAKWFRCVRVSDSVRHADHPLHTLFAATPSPRLVLCHADGSGLVRLTGAEPLSSLWGAMSTLLRATVDGDCEAAVKQELEILSRYDHLDNMETELSTQLDQLLESREPHAREVLELRQRLAALAAERAAVEALEARLMRLPPKVRRRP